MSVTLDASEAALGLGNARFVAFVSVANNLGSSDCNSREDVYVGDLTTGTTTLVSVNSAGTGSSFSGSPSISGDGRFVVFLSVADNLGPTGFQRHPRRLRRPSGIAR